MSSEQNLFDKLVEENVEARLEDPERFRKRLEIPDKLPEPRTDVWGIRLLHFLTRGGITIGLSSFVFLTYLSLLRGGFDLNVALRDLVFAGVTYLFLRPLVSYLRLRGWPILILMLGSLSGLLFSLGAALISGLTMTYLMTKTFSLGSCHDMIVFNIFYNPTRLVGPFLCSVVLALLGEMLTRKWLFDSPWFDLPPLRNLEKMTSGLVYSVLLVGLVLTVLGGPTQEEREKDGPILLGNTLFASLVQENRLQEVDRFLDRYPQAGRWRFLQESPLNVAPTVEMAELLIEKGGVTIDHTNGHGRNLLISSVFNQDLKLVKFCLASGADPNAGTHPPLFWAVMTGNKEFVALLLEASADPTFLIPGGKSLHQLALEKGHTEIAKMLESQRESD